LQNKNKKNYGRDRDDREDKKQEEEADPLKDATTLYVGNL